MRLTYGLSVEGKLTHVRDVDRGDACGCVCPACQSPLRAKKGKVVQHHFAHVNTECENAVESALHLAAKEVLAEAGAIWLPALTVNRMNEPSPRNGGPFSPMFTSVELFKAQIVPLSEVRLEQRLGDITPDLIANYRGTDLMVEIAVTHFIDNQKLAKIEQAGIATVEIDLSALDRMPDREELKVLLTQENDHITWAYSAKRQQVEVIERQKREEHARKLEQKLEADKAIERRKLNTLLSEMRGMMQPDFIKAKLEAWEQTEAGRERLRVLASMVGCSPTDFPEALNHPVKGEEAFGCDRRIWQSAFYYAFFIHKNAYTSDAPFRIKDALWWIRNKVPEAKIPYCISHIGYLARDRGLGMKPELELSPADRALLPDPYGAVEAYLSYLKEIGLVRNVGGTEYVRTGHLIGD